MKYSPKIKKYMEYNIYPKQESQRREKGNGPSLNSQPYIFHIYLLFSGRSNNISFKPTKISCGKKICVGWNEK